MMTLSSRLIFAACGGGMFLASCAPPRPMLGRPLTAIEECNYAVESKRRECNGCWFLLPLQIWPAFLCLGLCGNSADKIASECRAFAFAAEQHPARIDADITVHEGAPR